MEISWGHDYSQWYIPDLCDDFFSGSQYVLGFVLVSRLVIVAAVEDVGVARFTGLDLLEEGLFGDIPQMAPLLADAWNERG